MLFFERQLAIVTRFMPFTSELNLVNGESSTGWRSCWPQPRKFQSLSYAVRQKVCGATEHGIHSETGNICTHLIGFVAFITVAIIFYVKPLCDQCHTDVPLREKLMFLFFFVGAILCLGMSSLFHTVCCHSEHVSKLFNKLDYVGISLLTVGSFVPWLYYSFYCEFVPKLIYMIIISVLGIGTITITMMDRFTTAAYR